MQTTERKRQRDRERGSKSLKQIQFRTIHLSIYCSASAGLTNIITLLYLIISILSAHRIEYHVKLAFRNAVRATRLAGNIINNYCLCVFVTLNSFR